MPSLHPSDSSVQGAAEAKILEILSAALGVILLPGCKVRVGHAEAHPDGMAEDGSVMVEVFAHVGKLKGSQRHKVSTDALKLLAMRQAHPDARLVLAFAGGEAATSVSGWRAEFLKANGIEIRAVELPPEDKAKIEATQDEQIMVNPS